MRIPCKFSLVNNRWKGSETYGESTNGSVRSLLLSGEKIVFIPARQLIVVERLRTKSNPDTDYTVERLVLTLKRGFE